MPRCRFCHQPVEETDLYCAWCGKPLGANQAETTDQSDTVETSEGLSDSNTNERPIEPESTMLIDSHSRNEDTQKPRASDAAPESTAPDSRSLSYSAPSPDNNEENDMPLFEVPSENASSKAPESPIAKKETIPTFEPPSETVPTFIPPSTPAFDGPACELHPDRPAAARCENCGAYMCSECVEAFTITEGDLQGKAFCYDCIQKLFEEQRNELQKNFNIMRVRAGIFGVGVVLGGILGIAAGLDTGEPIGVLIWFLICASIGGSLPTFLKTYISQIPSMFTFSGNFVVSLIISIIKACVFFFIDAARAFVETSSKLYSYWQYFSQTRGLIDQSQQALDFIETFVEYTRVREANAGVDLSSLMQEGSELFDNAYAQQVVQHGESAADEMMRQSTWTIAANGEIIHNFEA